MANYINIELLDSERDIIIDVLKSRYKSTLKKNADKAFEYYWILKSRFGIEL